MQIHVARNSAQLGIFAPEEIVAGLQSGRFLASDLAWRDGIDRNLTTCFSVTRAALGPMQAAGYGRVVNIASTSGAVQALHS